MLSCSRALLCFFFSPCQQDQIKAELYDGEAEEEFEDSEGNVLNKRTYHDLARQGLL